MDFDQGNLDNAVSDLYHLIVDNPLTGVNLAIMLVSFLVGVTQSLYVEFF